MGSGATRQRVISPDEPPEPVVQEQNMGRFVLKEDCNRIRDVPMCNNHIRIANEVKKISNEGINRGGVVLEKKDCNNNEEIKNEKVAEQSTAPDGGTEPTAIVSVGNDLLSTNKSPENLASEGNRHANSDKDITLDDKACVISWAEPNVKEDIEDKKSEVGNGSSLTNTNINSRAGTSKQNVKTPTRAFRNVVSWSDDEDDSWQKPSETEVRQKSEPLTRKPSIIRPKNNISGKTGKSKGKCVIKLNQKRTQNNTMVRQQTNSKIGIKKVCFQCKLQSHPEEDKLLGVTWRHCSICLRWWHDHCLPYGIKEHTKPSPRRTVPKFRCPGCPVKPVCSVCMLCIDSVQMTATCDVCLIQFHIQCLPSNYQSDYKVFKKQKKTWQCGKCL